MTNDCQGLCVCGGRWSEAGVVISKDDTTNPWGDGTVLYFDSSGRYMNLHMIKMYRTKHTRTKYK